MRREGLENLTLMWGRRADGNCNRSDNLLRTYGRTVKDTNEQTFLRVAKDRGP